MKRQNTLLLFCFFSLLPLPFVISIFTDHVGLSAIWDGISFALVYVAAILFFLTIFNNTAKCSKNFFIYKLIWLQDMFILSGVLGTFLGFIFIFDGMALDADGLSGFDASATLISNFAIAIITLLYGVVGATTVYLIQKYYELKNETLENIEVKKPKEGFLFSSALYFFIVIMIIMISAHLGSLNTGGVFSTLLNIKKNIYMISFLIILILFYNGNSIINLIKNLFWYIPDQEKNIEYNLKYIRNMKKIVSMFIIISLMCAPIVMLVGLCCIPPEMNNIGWNHIPFIGIQNGGVIFLWSLFIIIIFSVIEGREVSKLYFETGKVSAGDRFFSLKYILSSAFLLFFTVSIGIMLTFVAL